MLAKETNGGLESNYGSSSRRGSIVRFTSVYSLGSGPHLVANSRSRISLLQVQLWPVLQESYPSTPPIWFVDSDDPSLAEVLERLEDVRKGSTLVSLPMRPRLVSRLRLWAHGSIWVTAACVFLCFPLSNQLLQQLKRLICDLCRLYNLPQHPDVEMLDQPLPTGPITHDRKVEEEAKRP